MTLAFYAAGDALVHERNEDGSSLPWQMGAGPRYVGREFVPAANGSPASHPATKEPYKCKDGTQEAAYLARECRSGMLYAADKETALALGVSVVPLEFHAGVWAQKSSGKSPKAGE
jgi:hypothetical protein